MESKRKSLKVEFLILKMNVLLYSDSEMSYGSGM